MTAAESDPLADALDRDRFPARFDIAWQALTATERRVLTSRFGLNGQAHLTGALCALDLGMAPRTVMWHQARALAKMRRILDR